MGKLKGWFNNLFQVIGDAGVIRTVFDKDGTLYHLGTALTPTAAELNALAGIGTGKTIPGARFCVTFPTFAAADMAKVFFVAPAACKLVSVSEKHITVAGQAGTMNIEKLATGDAPGNGNAVLTAAFDLTSTANTTVTKTAFNATYQTLAAGDSLALSLASGAATSLAGASLVVLLQWT